MELVEDGHRQLTDLFDRLNDDQFTRPKTIGGGYWSAKDLMGHVSFWEEIALATVDSFRRGEALRFDQAFAPGGIDELNEWNHRRKAKWSSDRVRRESEATHSRLIEEIGKLSSKSWNEVIASPNARRLRLGTRLGQVLSGPKQRFGHAFAHLPDLEAYVKSLRRTGKSR
jgi:DinB family protein